MTLVNQETTHFRRRRQVLRGAAAALMPAIPFGLTACAAGARKPLQVGGLPVTCNLTLPVACVAKAAANRALHGGVTVERVNFAADHDVSGSIITSV